MVMSSACSDISKSVRINVHKKLANNVISLIAGGADTTVCDGANPNRLTGTLPTGGTNIAGDYAYEWQYSTNNLTWNTVATAGTSQGYDPPALNTTTYYKRKVLSGVCSDISATTIKVNVLPSIGNNILTDPPVICKNSDPDPITGTAPTGGDGSYKYLWEESSDGGVTWTAARGVNNDASGNYNPPALNIDMQYKRNVTSGATNDCCSDVSNIVEITIHNLPSSVVDAGESTTIHADDGVYQLQAQKPFSYERGKWTISTGYGEFENDTLHNTFVTKIETENTYLWTVTNGPCINKDEVSIIVEDLVIPNGFSPNNDGKNDYFEVLGLNLNSQIAELSIVNSAGTEVFYSTNKNGNENWMNWDGKNSDGVDLPEGTYYYILKRIFTKVEKVPGTERGFILLKRK
jgi:gliding motility-associated-like protein